MAGQQLELEGKTAIVTGASRGIGKAIAQRLASAGAHVVIGARSIEKPAGGFAGTIHETAEEIRAGGGKVTPLALDVTDAESRESFITAAIEATGGVDILINNAGTALYKEIWTYNFPEAMSQMETYFIGPMHLCSLIVPHMIERGRGWIVNLGSSSVIKTPRQPYAQHISYFGHDVLYAAMKAAVHRFSQGLAAEVHPHNIAVNVLAPVGGVYTPGLQSAAPNFDPNHPAVEIIEQMAEAALELVAHPPKKKTGLIAWSHKHLDEVGRPTMSLDGKTVLVARSATEKQPATVS